MVTRALAGCSTPGCAAPAAEGDPSWSSAWLCPHGSHGCVAASGRAGQAARACLRFSRSVWQPGGGFSWSLPIVHGTLTDPSLCLRYQHGLRRVFLQRVRVRRGVSKLFYTACRDIFSPPPF